MMQDLNLSAMIAQLALIAPGFLLAITVHEYTHGYVAYKLGDPTAKLAGRLTFNPLSHLDLMGTIVLVLTRVIGWAKPVPVDPRYLRNPRGDMLWISLGGPAANLVTAVALSLLLRMLFSSAQSGGLEFLGSFILQPLLSIIYAGVQINVGLAIFNLVPIPPLDGYGILAGLLSGPQARQLEKIEPYGFLIFLVLLISGLLNYIIFPPIIFVQHILLQGIG
jgi:Zn-dependent protease